MKTEPSRQIFEKYLNIKFHELLLVAAELFHAHGRIDRPDETKSRFKADSHIACRIHALPLPCRASNGLNCVFSI